MRRVTVFPAGKHKLFFEAAQTPGTWRHGASRVVERSWHSLAQVEPLYVSEAGLLEQAQRAAKDGLTIIGYGGIYLRLARAIFL